MLHSADFALVRAKTRERTERGRVDIFPVIAKRVVSPYIIFSLSIPLDGDGHFRSSIIHRPTHTSNQQKRRCNDGDDSIGSRLRDLHTSTRAGAATAPAEVGFTMHTVHVFATLILLNPHSTGRTLLRQHQLDAV